MKKQLTTIMVRGDIVVVLRHTGNGTGACIQTHREEYKLSSMTSGVRAACIQTHREEYKLSSMTSGVRAMFDAVLAKLEPHPVNGSNTVFYRRKYSNGTNKAVAS